jgi:ribosomal-protein-alanine N-acetyltransferase
MDVLRGLGQTAYLGYFINNPFWGKGYGKEAARAAIDIAFRDVKLHRIEAGIEPRNRRSIFLARSLGLRKEGLKKRAVFLRGKWNDLIMYSATCEEFGFKWKGVPKTRPR